jgi:hypothetical protein
MLPQISDDRVVQAFYERLRWQGVSHALAEMLALQQPPGSKTDREFLTASENNRQFQDCPHIGNLYRRQAAAAGVSIQGKKYLSALARYPGDPEAWVTDRADVRRICEARGWDCQGDVRVKGRDPAEVEGERLESREAFDDHDGARPPESAG